MAKNWFSKLDESGIFTDFKVDPFLTGVITSSPSVNFTFSNTHLLPFGYTLILWGEKKAGKGVLISDMAGQLHKADPDAIVIKFNTEMREKVQMNQRIADEFDIDLTRYRARETNKPEEVFDFIEKDIPALIESGAKIKLIAIDSISDILGRRFLNADTVGTQQIGDHAATVQDGLKRIRSVIRKYDIALVMTAHARAELDPIEQMRGKKVKMEGAHYLKHFAEYFMYIARDNTKAAKEDLFGNKYTNEEFKDINDNPDILAHKIRVTMTESSVGLAGRQGQFTLHAYEGIINQWEEIFKLAISRGVLHRPNNRTYLLPNWPQAGEATKWGSFDDAAIAIRSNEDIRTEILKRIKLRDIDLHQKGAIQDDPNILEES